MQVLTRTRRHHGVRVGRHRLCLNDAKWPQPASNKAEPAPTWSEPSVGELRELFRFPGRPGGLAVASDGTIFVSGIESGSIWRVEPNGASIPLVARNQADWSIAPAGIAMTPDGTLMVADHHHHRICALTPDQEIAVVAGGASGCRDGAADQALFHHPSDVAVGPDGTCYVADSGNDRIRVISTGGSVSTLAGSSFDFGDGHGRDGRFRRPVALDLGPRNELYVADNGNNSVRRVKLGGEVTTLAGFPAGGNNDGNGANVGLRGPSSIAVGPDGSVWVADRDNSAVRRITEEGTATTELRWAGRQWPAAVAIGGDGSVVVAVHMLDDLFRPETRVMVVTG